MYHLDIKLRGSLTQPTINHCYLFDNIHISNANIQEMNKDGFNRRQGRAVGREQVWITDEEEFLLSVTKSHRQSELLTHHPCVINLVEALGECDSSWTTQLWKPGKSWWDAKSGKNPYLGPKTHRKRWRYLWPLIHYHKFLVKQIRKLKRWNVDVDESNAPLPTFLKDEVCSIAYHLATVSRYDSEQWEDCLTNFEHWADINPTAEKGLRKFIEELPLRIAGERDDADCPLLKDQIAGRHLSTKTKFAKRSLTVGQGKDNDAPPTEVNFVRRSPIEGYAHPPMRANFTENGHLPHQIGFNVNNNFQNGISHQIPMQYPPNNIYPQCPFVFINGVPCIQYYQHHGPNVGICYIPANQCPNNFGYFENGMYYYS